MSGGELRELSPDTEHHSVEGSEELEEFISPEPSTFTRRSDSYNE